jgi:hypothetical protein
LRISVFNVKGVFQMNMERRISDAARALGRVSGRTTAGALEEIQRNPSALDAVIDRAADPQRGDLVEVRDELTKRLGSRKKPPGKPKPSDTPADSGTSVESDSAETGPVDTSAADEPTDVAAEPAPAPSVTGTPKAGRRSAKPKA